MFVEVPAVEPISQWPCVATFHFYGANIYFWIVNPIIVAFFSIIFSAGCTP